MEPDQVSLGVFTYERATKRTLRYMRVDDDERRWTQYLSKDEAQALGNPEQIEVLIRRAGSTPS